LKPRATEPLYRQLARRIESAIRHRAYRAEERLPSVRRLAREQRVSIPTALQAYATLERLGLIVARPKSGFFVRAPATASVPPPTSPPIAARISDLSQTDPLTLIRSDDYDPRRVNLGAAVPSPDRLPGKALGRLLSAAARRLGATGVNYGPLEGVPALRREIARRSLTAGLALQPDRICVTLGATEAVTLALRATCSPGDTVVVESPTFFGLLRQLREMGLKALPIPVDPGTGLDLEALSSALRRTRVSAILVIPNFHNPVGFVMPEASKRELVRIAAAKAIPIIEDDLYADLPHAGPRPKALKAFDREDLVLLCSSFSKSIAPGYRVGYIAGGRWHERIVGLKKANSSGNPPLPSLAIADYLAGGGYDRFLRSFREACRVQVAQMQGALVASFPAGLRLSRPEGGYVLWCELAPSVDSMELFRRAQAEHIAIAPGPTFSSDGRYRNFIRVSCGHPWSDRIEAAVRTLGRLAAAAS
jgi:DNA-binding transcriptional MocR family regulator